MKAKTIPMRQYWEKNTQTKKYLNRRGFPVSLSYLYRLIRKDKAGTLREPLPFKYKEEGQNIFIVE